MSRTLWWVVFAAAVLPLLALDLGVFNRKAHRPSLREAAAWSAVWVAAAALFAGGLWVWRGGQSALQFGAGYIVELSLSVDNVFLFAVILTELAAPEEQQHRVLFWGVLGAIVMRAAMVFAGAALIERFHGAVVVFGVLLILTGIRMLLSRKQPGAVGDTWLVRRLRRLRRLLPVTDHYHDQRFFLRTHGRLLVTPLLLVLVLIELTDVMFAVDSIPAIFGLFPDPRAADTFLVFSSNIFAILGLRSLYFLLAGVMHQFRFLKIGLAFILVFVGFKMLGLVDIPIVASFGGIVLILAVALGASLWWPARTGASGREADAG